MPATPSITAKAVLFAINAGIKMVRNIQKAYARNLIARDIVLPLPKFNGTVNLDEAKSFFEDRNTATGGHQFLEKLERLQLLHQKAMNRKLDVADPPATTPAGGGQPNNISLITVPTDNSAKTEREEYLEFYEQYHRSLQIDNFGEPIQPEDLTSLLTIRQWERPPKGAKLSPLQLIAGTVVEIGVDYFTQFPGSLDTHTPFGQSIKRVLIAVDRIQLEEADQEGFRGIVKDFFPVMLATAAEVISDMSDEITGDAKLQAFIETVSTSLANDIYTRIKDPGINDAKLLDHKDRTIQWGQIILRSTLKNAGEYVFAAPEEVLDTNTVVSGLIQSTGVALMNIIIPEDSDKVEFRNVFDVKAIDSIMKAAFAVVAEHPGFFTDHKGIENMIGSLSTTLSKQGVNRPNLLPEMLRLILENTSNNLHLILFDENKPEEAQQLLLMAAQEILEVLAQEPPDGKWPRLTASQLLQLTNNLLQEVVTNPEWILKKVGPQAGQEKPQLRIVLEAVFSALAGLPKEGRLNARTIELVIMVSIRTAAVNNSVLDRTLFKSDQDNKFIIEHTLDLIFECVFKTNGLVMIDKINLLEELLDYILGAVITQHADPKPKGLILTRMILFECGLDFTGGFDRDLADQILQAALTTLAEHPSLASEKQAVQQIIKGVASQLQTASFNQPGLLAEFIRLCLNYTALNATLVIKSSTDQPRYLVAFAIGEILKALSDKPNAQDKWQPRLTAMDAVNITETLLEEVVQNPHFLMPPQAQDTSLLGVVLSAAFEALSAVPKGRRLHPQTLELILINCMRATGNSPKLLDNLPFGVGGKNQSLLSHCLDLVIQAVFRPEADGSDGMELMIDLLEYTLDFIIARHANPKPKGLVLAKMVLLDAGIDYSGGFNKETADQLVEAALQVLADQPELVTSVDALKDMISDIASALKAADPDRLQVLPELLRLALLHTAGRLDLLIRKEGNQATPKNLLVIALQKILEALTAPSTSGSWKPRLSDEQLLDVVDLLLEEITVNPRWLKDIEGIVTVLSAIFAAVAAISSDEKIAYPILRQLITESIQKVNLRKPLILEIEITTRSPAGETGEKKLALTYTLEYLFITLYDEEKGTDGAWRLSQTEVINAIIEHLLLGLTNDKLDQKAIDTSIKRIKKEIQDLNNGLSTSLQQLLQELSKQNNGNP